MQQIIAWLRTPVNSRGAPAPLGTCSDPPWDGWKSTHHFVGMGDVGGSGSTGSRVPIPLGFGMGDVGPDLRFAAAGSSTASAHSPEVRNGSLSRLLVEAGWAMLA